MRNGPLPRPCLTNSVSSGQIHSVTPASEMAKHVVFHALSDGIIVLERWHLFGRLVHSAASIGASNKSGLSWYFGTPVISSILTANSAGTFVRPQREMVCCVRLSSSPRAFCPPATIAAYFKACFGVIITSKIQFHLCMSTNKFVDIYKIPNVIVSA